MEPIPTVCHIHQSLLVVDDNTRMNSNNNRNKSTLTHNGNIDDEQNPFFDSNNTTEENRLSPNVINSKSNSNIMIYGSTRTASHQEKPQKQQLQEESTRSTFNFSLLESANSSSLSDGINHPTTTNHDDLTTSSSTGTNINSTIDAINNHNNNNSNSAVTNNTKKTIYRRIAIDLSLYLNLIILFSKLYAYISTLSLSVLAALMDSVLDVVSQIVLNYTEHHSSKSRSSALYPAGAARLEPVGVLTCAALMGMASFEILKESMESLFVHHGSMLQDIMDTTTMSTSTSSNSHIDRNILSVYGMLGIVLVKLGLYFLCTNAIPEVQKPTTTTSSSSIVIKQSVKVSDPTLEALAQDHWNDALSNLVAAGALFAALIAPDLWFLDPIGAILISLYIIYSWYETGKEQIEQLTGKSAPDEFIDELSCLASNFDSRMIVDVVRAYHFGPKFLVELEVVLPKDTLLFESHDLGMELQYEIEAKEEVERCFVHIDYEQRPYDEHVVSKVPELRAKYRPSANSTYCHSV
jgi:cation diffusion facilitator family transporter